MSTPTHRHKRSLGWLAAALTLALAVPARADRLSTLAAALRSDSEKERISAAVQLGRLDDDRAVRPLLSALLDPSNLVRAVAAGALGHLGDPAALPALQRAATDPDRTVRRRAIEAMARLRPGAAVRDEPMASYKLDGREAPRDARRPSLFVVMKSSADRTAPADATAGRERASELRRMLLRELATRRDVTLEPREAERLGIQPFALDVTIVKLERAISGPFVEIHCELRVAVSNPRGQMLSFLTGGAKVQVPRASFQGRSEGRLRLEALENAVKSVNQDLIAFLHRQPGRGG